MPVYVRRAFAQLRFGQQFLIVFLILCVATPAAAGFVIINFDNLPSTTVVTDQYSTGALFSSSAGSENYAIASASAVTPPNVLLSGAAGSANGTADTYVDFTMPLFDLQFWAIEPNAPGVVAEFRIFEHGIHTHTESLVGLGGAGAKLVQFNGYDWITRLEIVNITDPGGIGWDSFFLNQVPEPATFIAVSLLALAMRRRQPRVD